MASADYSFIETFAAKFKDPDGWDAVGTPTGSADQFFAELGKLAKKIQEGKLTTADVQSAKASLSKFSDGINRLNARIAGAASSNAEDAKFAKAFKSMAADVNLKFQQFSYAADEVIAGRPSSLASLSESASGILKSVGGLLGLAQIANEFYKNGFTAAGVDAAGEKALGVLSGMVAAEVVAAVAGVVFVGLGAPVLVVGAAAIGFGALAGYAAGKAGEALWEPSRWWFENELLPSVFDAGTQAYNTISVGLDDLSVKMGNFDGTWLEGLDATDEQKAAFTTLLAGVSHLPASPQMNADIKRLLEAPFDGSTLVSRDVLIKTILLISQEQHAYVSERVTLSAGVVTLKLPSGTTQAVAALRSMAQAQLDAFDQTGFALTGPNRVVVSPIGGTLAGETGNDLMIGSSGVDGLIGNEGNDELIAGAGDDILLGGEGVDVLFGGAGNDLLDGGDRSDYLYGGTGDDTYQFTGSFGSDWVVDSDGQGVIQVDALGALTGAGAQKISEGIWQTADKRINYTLIRSVSTGGDLHITFSDRPDAITLRHWSPEHNVGITLPSTLAEPMLDNTLAGEFTKQTAPDGITYLKGPDGNYLSAGAASNTPDDINGTALADKMTGGANTDGLAGGSGDDSIDGGDGDDLILGAAGADTLLGGAGDDRIFGGGGFISLAGSSTQAPVALGPELLRGASWVVYQNPLTDAYNVNTEVYRGAAVGATDSGSNFIDGGAGDDTLYGGVLGDAIHGGTGADRIEAIGGNDVVFGDAGDDRIDGDGLPFGSYVTTVGPASAGDDILDGGAGNDLVIGNNGSDDLYGADGNDILLGDDNTALYASYTHTGYTPGACHGRDVLDGGAGNDQLIGGGQDDRLYGGDDNDTLLGDDTQSNVAAQFHGNDYLDGEAGADQLTGGGRDDTLFGGDGNDTLLGDDTQAHLDAAFHGNDYLDGEAGDDQLAGGAGADTLFGGDGKDVLLGDDLAANLAGNFHGNDALDGEAGNDLLIGGGGLDQLRGGDGNDELQGDGAGSQLAGHWQAADDLDGGAGNDLLFGQGGDDSLYGGDGNDELQGDANQADLAGNWHGNDWLDGGSGNDLVFGQGGADSLDGGDGDDRLYGDALQSDLDIGFHGNDVLDGGSGNDSMAGGGGDDVLLGGSGDDLMLGDSSDLSASQGGADTLDGGDGNDLIDGQGGNDQMHGRDGDDVLWGGAGNDLVSGDAGNDHLLGGDGDDTLLGGDGNDVLISSRGADSLAGGAGDDTYWLDFSDAAKQISDVEGVNRVGVLDAGGLSGWTMSLPAGSFIFQNEADLRTQLAQTAMPWVASSLDLQSSNPLAAPKDSALSADAMGAAALTGAGDAGNNRIYGSTANDTLSGHAGDDQLFGDDGDDRLDGGDGADLLQGGAGSDTLLGQAGNDTLEGGDGDDSLLGASVGVTGDDVLMGEGGNDYLAGGDGNDTLDGGTGDDNLQGWGGVNTYLFGRGDGHDFVQSNGYATSGILQFKAGIAPTDVLVNPEQNDYGRVTLRIAGTDDTFGLAGQYTQDDPTGAWTTVQQIRFADGTAWNMQDIVMALHHGTTGNDNLIALNGGDTLHGLAGDDRLQGGNGSNALYGDEGDDRLLGSSGSDTLDGGAGADILDGGSGNNVYMFGRGDGQDTILRTYLADVSTRNGTLQFKEGVLPGDLKLFADGSVLISGTNDRMMIEDLTRAGGAIQQFRFANGTVWNRTQILTQAFAGTAGDDNILGSNINDTISGLAGNDTLNGMEGSDVINGGDGDDLLQGGSWFGEGGNDTLNGGAGNDTLDGSAGNDRLTGGTGDDDYYVDSAQDVVVELANEGADTVKSQVNWTLGANQENLLVNGDLLTGSGNALANRITANGAGDTLTGGLGNDTLMARGEDATFVFNRGDGQDTIDLFSQAASLDTLRFGASVADTDIVAFSSGDDLVVKIRGTADQITVLNHYEAATPIDEIDFYDSAISRIIFSSGIVWDAAAIQTAVSKGASNHAPMVTGSIPLLGAKQGSLFSYVIPASSITDTDAGDWITHRVTSADGSALPAWLSFDPTTRTLSGTPGAPNLGTIHMIVVGVDAYGASAGFNAQLAVAANRAPALSAALPDQAAAQGSAFTYAVPATSFTDPDLGDTLTYSAASADGTALPSWLAFNATTRTFTGTPTALGRTSVKVTARDAGNLSASDVFDVVTAVQNLTLTGTSSANTLVGGAGNDTLSGLGGNDTLTGGAGNDLLDGGTGTDSMTGNAGNDTYVVDVSGDVAIEFANEGIDLVQSSVTCTLSANVENLVLTGHSALNGTGNASANVLTGNSANNTLSGLAGADTLDGGAGNDTLNGAAGADTYLFARGYGIDTVQDKDSTAGVKDRIQFASGIAKADIVYKHVGNNLEALVGGTSDKLVIQDWYLGSQFHVEEFRFNDGSVLLDSQVQSLVSAMASFSAPASDGPASVPEVWRGTLPVGLAVNAFL